MAWQRLSTCVSGAVLLSTRAVSGAAAAGAVVTCRRHEMAMRLVAARVCVGLCGIILVKMMMELVKASYSEADIAG